MFTRRNGFIALILAVLVIAIAAIMILMADSEDEDAETLEQAPAAQSGTPTAITPATGATAVPSTFILAEVTEPDPREENPTLASANDYYGFAWQMFMYVNQPYIIFVGGSLTRWEAWQASTDIYLPCGARPADYNTEEPPALPEEVKPLLPEGVEYARPMLFTDKFLESTIEIDGETLVDTNGNPIRFEVRMNPSTVNTVMTNGFYNRDNQVAYFNSSRNDFQFAPESLEVKASWRQLLPSDDASRYYVNYGYYYDQQGNPVVIKVGLTGLHITSKFLPNWIWMTFEQVDNQTMTTAPLVDPIPPDVQQVNDTVHNNLPATSIWRYYNLRGVQTEFAINGQPTILANTQIETQFQESSSCITCHGLATIGASSDGRLGFFDFFASDFRAFVGGLEGQTFYATDDTEVFFNGVNAFAQQSGRVRYKQLDFVWSLKEAQSPSMCNQ